MASMTYLELCKRVRLYAAVAGDGPSAVTGQTDIYAAIVAWVADSYEWIQTSENEWKFRWETGTFTNSLDEDTYTVASGKLASDIEKMDFSSFFIYETANPNTTKRKLRWASWKVFQDRYIDTEIVGGLPTYFTRNPDGDIVFSKEFEDADDTYTIEYNYYKTPDLLEANNDVPVLPERFHMVIVWHALQDYAHYYNAPEVLARAEKRYAEMYWKLKDSQLVRPKVVKGSFTFDRRDTRDYRYFW